MSCSLKIQPHIRGHVSSCNGRVDLVGAKVEQCQDHIQSASNVASEIETQLQREREKKKKGLAKFQKRVKQRAFEWERTKQLQLAARTTETVESELKIAEQAVKLDKIKVQTSVEIGQDVEDIRTVAAARDSAHSTSPSASRLARTNLLTRKGSNKTSLSISETSMKKQSVQFAPTVQYVPVDYADQSTLSENKSPVHDNQDSGWRDHIQTKMKVHKKREPSKASKKFSNPGQLEQVEKKEAALQYLLFRRLYSDLEREQARQNHRQQTHAQRVDILKRHKEAVRRLAEEEVNTLDSFSSVNTETTEDQQRAREWSELMILEERKQELQKSRENERYVEALQARFREKLQSRQFSIPPLCSCGTSVWDTNPFTCANNCPFYRNPKAYEKALSSLLQTLEL